MGDRLTNLSNNQQVRCNLLSKGCGFGGSELGSLWVEDLELCPVIRIRLGFGGISRETHIKEAYEIMSRQLAPIAALRPSTRYRSMTTAKHVIFGCKARTTTMCQNR